MLIMARPALAETPPTPSHTPQELASLFPSSAQLPAGMVLEDEGSRSADEIVATFPDPDDAAHVLQVWGWSFNVYRVYVAGIGAEPETPTRLEVSLHQFSTNIGAAYALSYYAHGRAVMLDQAEGLIPGLRPCEAEVSRGSEVTRYLRYGDMLVRVTTTMPEAPSESTYYLALRSATAMAFAVMENAGGSLRELDQTCR